MILKKKGDLWTILSWSQNKYLRVWLGWYQKNKVEFWAFISSSLRKILLFRCFSGPSQVVYLIFGCWDTIVTTFFITYLDEALKDSAEIPQYYRVVLYWLDFSQCQPTDSRCFGSKGRNIRKVYYYHLGIICISHSPLWSRICRSHGRSYRYHHDCNLWYDE